jgi:hypothetical protein
MQLASGCMLKALLGETIEEGKAKLAAKLSGNLARDFARPADIRRI